MKKVIEFNPKYNLGDIIYGIHDNKVVKAKITSVNYHRKSTLVTDTFLNDVTYGATDVNETLESYYIRENTNNTVNGVWFKSKDDAIDYLKTQIDKITTDDYNQTFTANN